MLQSLHYLCGSLPDSFLYVHVSLVLGSPALDTALQTCLTRADQRRRITSLDLLAALCLKQPKMLVAFFAISTHSWIIVSFLLIRTPRSILPSCFSTIYSLTVWVPGIIPSHGKHLAFPFAELHKAPVSLLLQPIKVLLNESTPICCISHFSQFCIICIR